MHPDSDTREATAARFEIEEDRPVGSVTEYLSILDSNIEGIAIQIDSLRSRLGSVLTDEETSPGALVDANPRRHPCETGSRLLEMCERTERLRVQLVTLRDRVDL